MNRTQFQLIFNALSKEEKAIVKLCALGFEEVRQSHLCAQLNAANVLTDRGTKFNSLNIKTYLQQLQDDGWVEPGIGQTFQLVKSRLHFATIQTVSDPDFPVFKKAFLPKPTQISYGFWYYGNRIDLVRELRLAYFTQDANRFQNFINIAQYRYSADWKAGFFYKIFGNSFDHDWITSLPLSWQALELNCILTSHYYEPTQNDELVHFLRHHPDLRIEEGAELQSFLNQLLLFRGELTSSQTLTPRGMETWASLGREVMRLVLQGDDDQAIRLFPKALKAFRETEEERNAGLSDLSTVFYLFALLRHAGSGYVKNLNKYIGNPDFFEEFKDFVTAISLALTYQQNNIEAAKKYLNSFRGKKKNLFTWMAYGWSLFWLDETLTETEQKELVRLAEAAEEQKLDWFAFEFSTILAHLHLTESKRKIWQVKSQALQQKISVLSFIQVVSKKAAWERALDMIANLGDSTKTAQKQVQKRLVWLIDFEAEEIIPKEQQLSKSGQWTSGRNIALKRLKSGKADSIQQQDLAVINLIQQGYYDSWNYSNDLTIPFSAGILALTGHPHLFFYKSPAVGIELVSRSLQLNVEENKDGFLVNFNLAWDGAEIIMTQETPTRYAVVETSDVQRAIFEQIGSGLEVPARARKQLEQTIQRISQIIPVSSTLDSEISNIQIQEGATDIVVHLLPMGDGFKIEFFVKPFQNDPPYFKPGRGQEKIIVEFSGEKRMAQRRLDREMNNAQAVINACPSLQQLDGPNFEWVIGEAVACLNVLLELQPLRDSGIIKVEHPKGEPIRLVGKVDFDNLSLRVQKDRGWFDVDGELRINDEQVLLFRELLEKVSGTDSHFIQLNDGQFVALTERFRHKLRELDAVLNSSGKQLQLHPLAGEILDDVSGLLAQFEEDTAWLETKQRLAKAKKIQAIVPSTFQGELRPYQMDGFKWLTQMATWGVGACLADDMGLGKTIQALALLIARAEMGPAMVIAPASVTRNWLRETQKFAPTLRPQLLGTGDRAEMIDGLGPYDLLLVSYGLLPYEVEKLAAKSFSTLILDEAQSIKNRSTKRSKAAKALQADFRMITTGTPIENHLGELWNLFHFLNPGLLGSLEQFNQRFAVPIERYGDREKRMQLRGLLQAFILRRRKNDVLQELPSKTEINLSVELSPEEMAFYEALRQKALAEIAGTEGPGQRFQILAQLTYLRQAACHPQLVDASSSLPSSKLELVAETILELLDNGHKALVFSQFVKHLKLVEAWVKSQNIAYQYLDGQTPGKKRDEAVQAFQRGEGELFLISLKAGGTGLNLTAADYVLHLDPWWNPAVEDQASDRAHRIGQQRPVTVYRFISEHTIEEKIVQLHHDKRDLADNLLAGTESSASLSTEELIALIKEI